jgi:hypothetical protein
MLHKKNKFKFLIKPAIIFTIATFIIPFFPMRGSGKNMATLYGTEKSILSVGIFFTICFIWMAIVKLNEYKAEKFDILNEMEIIESNIDKLKN